MKAVTQEAWAEATATKTLDLAQMDALVKQSVEAWEEYDAKKKEANALMLVAEAVDSQILQALKDAGKSSYKVDGFGTVSLAQKSVVRVPGTIEAKKTFFSYLRTLGEDVLFAMATVNSNTLNSWYNEKLDEAASLVRANGGTLDFSVPGIEQPTMRESLRFRKG